MKKKKTEKLIKSFICAFLVVSLSFGMPISHLGNVYIGKTDVYAEEVMETPGPTEILVEETISEEMVEATVLGEKVELRDANKKYFEMSDGTTKACIYPQSVHYLKDGEYEEIDNTLEYIEIEETENTVIETEVPVMPTEDMLEENIDLNETIVEETLSTTEEPLEETVKPTEKILEKSIESTEEVILEENVESTEGIQEENIESNEEIQEESIEPTEILSEEAKELTEPVPEENSELDDVLQEKTEIEVSATEETVFSNEELEESGMLEAGAEDLVITEDEENTESLELSDDEKRRKKDEKTKIRGSHYKNKANAFDVLLPEDYSNDYTEFSDENGYVRFKLVGTSNVKLKKEDGEKLDRKDKTVAKNINSKASYKELKKNVDIEYEVTGDSLKETIVLNKETKDDFVFEVFSSSEDLRLNDDGSVDFYDENGEKLYIIGAPYMVDAAGEYSGKIEVSLEEKEDGYLLTYSPDEEWLYDKSREYPVKIDPTMIKVLGSTSVKDTFITSVQDGTEEELRGDYDVIVIGKRPAKTGYAEVKMRGLVQFEIPDVIKAEDSIINAKLHLIHNWEEENVDGIQIDVHEVTGAPDNYDVEKAWWETAITYNQYPSEYCLVDTSRILSTTENLSYDSYDITELVNKWHNGADNYGMMLKLHDEDATLTSDKEVCYFSSQSKHYKDLTRYIEITYRNTTGLEDYWAYSSHNVGRAGTGYINLYNGNQVFVHQDVSNNTLINGFTLSHVYNSSVAAIDNADDDKEYYGVGWNLNLVQTIKVANIDGNSTIKYVYADGDGTKHYFVETDGKTVDEDGLGLTYTPISNGELVHQITTKDDTLLQFDNVGYLRKIIDKNNNYINLNYSPISGGRYMTTITTSSGDSYRLNYDSSNQLEYIEDKAGRTTWYFYDSSNCLSYITYQDGTTSTYKYNVYKLNYIREPGGSGTNYNHTGNGRVNKIDYVGNNGAGGLRETFTYDYCKTKVSEQDLSDKEEKPESEKDLYSTYYLFDTAGRATSIYDSEGNILTQKYTEESTSGDKIFSNNKTELDSNGTVYSNNLIKNGSFSEGTSGWGLGNGTITVDTSNALNTSKTIKIVNSDITTSVIYQMLGGMSTGSYTLSAYVKGEVTGGLNTGGIGVKIKTTEGREFISDMIKSTDDVITDNGFTKVSTSVTLLDGEEMYSVEVGLFGASGTAYIDSIQLEEGVASGPINLLRNSGFERSTSSVPSGYTASSGAGGGVSTAKYHEGTSSLLIPGNVNSTRNYSQLIKSAGTEGDTYKFGCWGFAYSMPVHNDNKPFGMKLVFNNTDGTTTEEYSEFNPVVKDWQFTSNMVIAKKDYSSINVVFYYNNNLNNAYFDSAFVYKDTAASYTYDENGNVVSTADYASGQTEFQYNNNTLSKLINPNGSGYEYYYDAKKNLIGAKESSGVQTVVKNSETGNPTKVRILSSDNSATIEDGETYYIRLKGSGKYLTAENGGTANSTNVVQAEFEGTDYQKWKVTRTVDGYYMLSPAHATTKNLDIVQGLDTENTNIIIWSVNYGVGQKFKFEPQSDYTYKIVPECTKTDKGVSVKNYTSQNNVSLSEGTGADSNSWYFENVDNEPVTSVESGKIYRIRAYHSGKYVDVKGAVSTTGTKLQQYQLKHGENQYFYFTKYAGTSYYQIRPIYTTSYLGVSDEKSATYTNNYYLNLAGTAVKDSALFKLVYDTENNKGFQIIPKSDQTIALEVANSSLSNSVELIFDTIGTDNNSYFVLEECSPEVVTEAKYDLNDRYISEITDERGGITKYVYDVTTDVLESVTDPKGNITEYEYYLENSRLKKVKTENSEVGYSYLKNGALDTITSPSGTLYKFNYDVYGRTTSTVAGGRTLGSYTYKNNYSNLVSRFDYGNGAYITYEYDSLDRLTKSTRSDTGYASGSTTYKYDKLGNVSEIKDYNLITKYNYDLSGRVTSLSDSNGYELSYVYDKYNRIKKQSYTSQNATVNTTYDYGDNSVEDEKTGLIYGISYGGAGRNIYYKYDDLNRKSTKIYDGNGLPVLMEYKYTAGADVGRASSLVHGEALYIGGACEYYNQYYYDINGNIIRIDKDYETIKEYSYDELGQLKYAFNGSNMYQYNYDESGNITSVLKDNTTIKNYTYGDANWPDLLTAYNGEAITYDEIGNPIQYRSGMLLDWAYGRNLSSVDSNDDYVVYTYDSEGYRTNKIVNNTATNFKYINGVLMSEKTGTEELVYLYDENGNPVGVSVINGSSRSNYFYILNMQGDVTGIIDEDGVLVVEYTYDDWGNVLSITGTGATGIGQKNHIRYRGYYYDEETGFYYVSSRYYDPETGRFINSDKYISNCQGVLGYNIFTYCNNNPIMFVDKAGCHAVKIDNKETVGDAIEGVDADLVPYVTGTLSGTTVSQASLPPSAEPNSTGTLHNPDGSVKQKRWYGPDGNAERDRDYNHPGNVPFPHDHVWKDGNREKKHLDPSPDYEFSLYPVAGVLLVGACAVGIVAVAADDVTGVGVVDDALLVPLAKGIEEGLIMIMK